MKYYYVIISSFLIFIICCVSSVEDVSATEKSPTVYEEIQQYDVTGDKVKETIKVSGEFYEDSPNLKQITLQVVYGGNKASVSIPIGYGAKPVLHIVDLNHDGVKDVFLSVKEVGDSPSVKDFGYSFKNEKVINFLELPKLDTQTNFQDEYKVKIKLYNDTYIVDVSTRKKMYEELGLYHHGKLNEPIELIVSNYVNIKPTYTIKGKGIEATQMVSGSSETDIIGEIKTIWIIQEGKWKMQNVSFRDLVSAQK